MKWNFCNGLVIQINNIAFHLPALNPPLDGLTFYLEHEVNGNIFSCPITLEIEQFDKSLLPDRFVKWGEDSNILSTFTFTKIDSCLFCGEMANSSCKHCSKTRRRHSM